LFGAQRIISLPLYPLKRRALTRFGTAGGFRRACLLICLASCGVAFAQSPLALCTQAFYRGEYAQAEELAQQELRRVPNDAATRVMLARAKLAQGKFQEAFDALQTTLAHDPKNVDALYYLSLVAKELSQREFQRLWSLAPDSSRVHQLLAEAALAADKPTEAEAEFQSALKANPRSVGVLTEFAELKRTQSKFDEAMTYYSQGAQLGPLTYEIAYGLGACYTYKQEYTAAADWLRKAVALAPDSVAARFAFGNALFHEDQFAAAIPELKAALQMEPKMKQAYFLLGRAYSRLGRQVEARAALRKLDELNRAEMPGSQKSNPQNDPPPNPRE
jgi:tetratricopeptide (TPR) repeat protein